MKEHAASMVFAHENHLGAKHGAKDSRRSWACCSLLIVVYDQGLDRKPLQ